VKESDRTDSVVTVQLQRKRYKAWKIAGIALAAIGTGAVVSGVRDAMWPALAIVAGLLMWLVAGFLGWWHHG